MSPVEVQLKFYIGGNFLPNGPHGAEHEAHAAAGNSDLWRISVLFDSLAQKAQNERPCLKSDPAWKATEIQLEVQADESFMVSSRSFVCVSLQGWLFQGSGLM